MKKSTFWHDDICSTSHVHKIPSLNIVLSQINPIHTLTAK
jgi:hypothetical protein